MKLSNNDKIVECKAAVASGIILLMMFAAVAFMSTQTAHAGSVYVETGAGYRTGNFGTPIDSHLVHIVSKVGYFTEDFELNAAVPYLFLRNESNAGHDMNRGLGDLVFRAGGYLAGKSQAGFSLYGSFAVKLPTAAQEKGLGTGKTNYGVFLSLNKQLDRIAFWVTGGAIKVGSPTGQDLNDIFLYGAGISWEFRRSRIFLSIDGYRQITPESEAPISAAIGIFHILSPNYSVKGDVQVGLTEGAPDYGASFGLVRFFH